MRIRGVICFVLFLLLSLGTLFVYPQKPKKSNEEVLEQGRRLVYAARHNDISLVKALIGDGIDVNIKDNNGITALIEAACGGYIDIVRILINTKADVNAKHDKSGTTALMAAASEGHIEIVQMLLDAKADIEVKQNDNGQTALWQSVFVGRSNIVRILINAKADVNTEDKHGITALWLAETKGYKEIAQMLKEAGAKPKDMKFKF